MSQVAAAAGWMHCYKTLLWGDDGPKSDEEIVQFLTHRLPLIRSWGVIDKNSLTNPKQEAPIVGLIVFEPGSPYNGYTHLASNRKAWGNKLCDPSLMDQAAALCVAEVFDSMPDIQRISVATFAKNAPAKAMCKRLGFHKDGYFVNMGKIDGVPQDVVHYGLTRPAAASLTAGA